MADNFDFDLAKEAANTIIEKRRLGDIRCRVGNALDVTGSTKGLYENGTMQRYLNRGLALALKMDDDGLLDTWAFDIRVHQLESVNADNYQGYVRDRIMTRQDFWGTTRYAPPIQAAYRFWFGVRQAEERSGFFARARRFLGGGSEPAAGQPQRDVDITSPSLLLFWTDGDNDPEEVAGRAAERALEAIANKPLYVAFVGVGDRPFTLIQRAARDYPNVGCLIVKQREIETISDAELYERLVDEEMTKWLRARAA